MKSCVDNIGVVIALFALLLLIAGCSENSGVSSEESYGVSSAKISLSSSGASAVTSSVSPSPTSSFSSSVMMSGSSSATSSETSSATSSETGSSSSAQMESSSSVASLLNFDFYMGADISTVQEYEYYGIKLYDVDGSETDIFSILKKYGFNAIRLKTFVSPTEKYGYAASGCGHDAESFGDKEHILAYAKKVKEAGMALFLDIHYSDNWADPGNQIIPSHWRGVKSSDELADSVYAYTFDLISSLKRENATPEMVQIGNETTPGILMHVPNSNTDCWGNNPGKASSAISGDMGTSSGLANAVKYFKAGIRAVKDVSPLSKTVLHVESIRYSNKMIQWITEILVKQGVPADMIGISAYTAYGDNSPDSWISLFESMTNSFPNVEFAIVEYNGGDSKNHYAYDGSRKRANEIVRDLNHWVGTFFWEPTMEGGWGAGLFDWDGNNAFANKEAFEEFADFAN